jgi:nucleotide-binding universal stress UspA family protein
MLSSILITLDKSVHSETLVELGIRWARRLDATLLGLGVVDEPGIRVIEPAFPVGGTPGVDPVYYMGYDARLAEVQREVDHLLQQFAARCAETGVKHETIKRVGSPAQMIPNEAQSCDLILMSRYARFRFTAKADETDETLKKVLRNAARPVVVVPETASPEGPVAIAYDGSLQAARALAAFQATGLTEIGQVHIVCIDASHYEGTQHFERARRFLAHHKIEAVPHLLDSSGSPARLIMEQVRRLGARLLVMGSYGQPVMREFFLGSVTRSVLSECPVPLFLFH